MKTIHTMFCDKDNKIIAEGFIAFKNDEDFRQIRLKATSILLTSCPSSAKKKTDVFQKMFRLET